MQRLRNANLKLQPDKCEFLRHEVAYLGHIIGDKGVKPDPNKIKSIMEFPTPRTPKNIKQFLGLAGYYRRFIPNFSKTAKPLTDLLKKNSTFNWQIKQVEAFNILKHSLCSSPVLQYPDFTKPFVLTTDASECAVGGVLSQGPVGKDLPIAYTSRVLNSAEQNYSTIEKECLTIIYCTHHFRPYLYGRTFTIVTDHKPLIWLHSIKDPTSRLWKWRTKLAEYDYEIKYKKGTLNNNADALSRNPPANLVLPLFTSDNASESSNESLFSPRRDDHIQPSSSNNALIPVSNNNSVNTNRQNLTIEEYSDSEENESFTHDDDLNYVEVTDLNSEDSEYIEMEMLNSNNVPYEHTPLIQQNPNQLIVKEIRGNLLNQKDNHVIFIHLNGTPFDNGARLYQEANIIPEYRNLTYERANTKQPMIITDTPGTAFDKISLDIVGPLPITPDGYQYVLTMQDLLTKYSVAVPLREATSMTIADAFTKNFICIYGAPKAILTDQGANFLSALMRALTKKFNIQHFKTTAYHPQSNGSIERSHHVLVEYLKTQIDKEENWNKFINLAMFSYNTSVHEGTKFSPYELVFGRLARLPSAYPPLEENLETTYHEYITTLFNKLHDTREEARQNLIRAKEKNVLASPTGPPRAHHTVNLIAITPAVNHH
ncbi:enzymatic polyprotein endonuclease reverse [Lasius niger]|uniref:Enzymatic polyprotein endonuclease reverse n=1 Tax=Lasius niger TaxID=67767 RepID=A0A0J7KEG3_LASNI|nr:enzymatic polyprotein endonuclease reverse [Lasius niger]